MEESTPALSPGTSDDKLPRPAALTIRHEPAPMTTLSVLPRLGLPAALLLLPLSGGQQQGPADLVFKNAKIYTANDKNPRAEAVAVKGDKILFVGKNDAADKLVGPATKVIDLRG